VIFQALAKEFEKLLEKEWRCNHRRSRVVAKAVLLKHLGAATELFTPV
jgi:precorrin-6B methylase 2